jgi:exoribonuclease-2
MPDLLAYPDSLAVYKGRAAHVRHVGKTLEIELAGGEVLNVRTKDVTVLHPGPLRNLDELRPPAGDVQTAWELLAGGTTDLAELAELAYGRYTPATAWAAWQLLAEGLYFRGTPQEIAARSADEVARERQARQERADEEQAWAGFIRRAHAGKAEPADRRFLREVEDVALGRRERSRVLRDLKRAETPEGAHALLLALGAWDEQVDPYPQRFGLTTEPVRLEVPPLPAEARRDLTHLPTFAIDDEGNQEPDDALSLEGNRLWVHIADVAALVPPGGALDLEARARGATLYLPEGPVRMVPAAVLGVCGLGLAEVSPALSFGLDLDRDGAVVGVEIVPSWVRVTRLTYAQAEARLGEAPFRGLAVLAEAHRGRRRQRGAVLIELPEVKIQVDGGRVLIQPLPPLRSRELVEEAMLMVGAAVARWGLAHRVPLPFTTQETSASDERPEDLAGMYALRQTLRPSQQSAAAAPHAGLGLEEYVQVTSPLRRYLDLVAHQQLRAALQEEAVLDTHEMIERIGAAVAAAGSVRQAERLARRHWTLVYLTQHPVWQGEGLVVEKRERRSTVLIPELGLDCPVHLRRDVPLNSVVGLSHPEVNLPLLDVHFQAGDERRTA